MDYDFTLEKQLVKEASVSGNWLYEPESKNWWSPDEFEEQFIINSSNHNFATRRWVENVKIRDPRVYAIEFVIFMEPLLTKAAKHAKKVKQYYKDNPQYIKV